MKYCPYCGASIAGGAASFCSECGKKIPAKPEMNARMSTMQKPLRRRPKPPHRKTHTKSGPRPHPSNRKQDPMDINYDGYYDDVQPIDAGQQSDRMDTEMIKQVALLLCGAVLVIILAASLMILL
ncbi:zinc ribbon domain-containing protein [uncultured Oscillibacter sp.]|uniref:zinc ribbon domain-containing protein n=1 Tax=uncultured Oscillibacter sp. TaxID=876091 RepID=UPI00280A828F|nr:zinc ribbon domain-containing protein [uncultured Oscillibacter sp.]